MTRFFPRRRYSGKTLIFLAITVSAAIFGVVRERPHDQVVAGPFHVVDGDTLTIGGLRMRLRGLDAPEMKQRCGEGQASWSCGIEARKALQSLVAVKATCKTHGSDKYRRRLVRCSAGGEDIGSVMVRDGRAVAYGDYTREEAQAKASRRGIWSGPFEKPEAWRKAHRNLAPAEERNEQKASFADGDDD